MCIGPSRFQNHTQHLHIICAWVSKSHLQLYTSKCAPFVVSVSVANFFLLFAECRYLRVPLNPLPLAPPQTRVFTKCPIQNVTMSQCCLQSWSPVAWSETQSFPARISSGVLTPVSHFDFCSGLSDLSRADPARMSVRLGSVLIQLPHTQSRNPNPHNGIKDGCWGHTTLLQLIPWLPYWPPCCVQGTPLPGVALTFLGQPHVFLPCFLPTCDSWWRCSLTSPLGHAGHAAPTCCTFYFLPLFLHFLWRLFYLLNVPTRSMKAEFISSVSVSPRT